MTPPEPLDPDDPKGLVRESYRIEGISVAECRSILVDWALSLPLGADPQPAIRALLDRHDAPDHPMTRTLQGGLAAVSPAARRGGRAARMRQS